MLDVTSKACLFLAASFEAARAVTGVMRASFAVKAWIGRKKVILVGAPGSLLSIIGFVSFESFYWALFIRFVGDIMNGNVYVMRTVISEIKDEKRY